MGSKTAWRKITSVAYTCHVLKGGRFANSNYIDLLFCESINYLHSKIGYFSLTVPDQLMNAVFERNTVINLLCVCVCTPSTDNTVKIKLLMWVCKCEIGAFLISSYCYITRTFIRGIWGRSSFDRKIGEHMNFLSLDFSLLLGWMVHFESWIVMICFCFVGFVFKGTCALFLNPRTGI